MPYILKQFDVIKGERVEDFLVNEVQLSASLALKLLQKGRVLDDKKRRLQKGQVLKSGSIELSIFEAQTKNLKPLFNTEHFALFDKPSGLLVHPVARSTKYTLLDEIRYWFGKEASLVHRIDQETSGLVLVAKNAYSNMLLSQMFEKKEFVKKYHALVEGKINHEIHIDKKIGLSQGIIKLKMQIQDEGKASSTLIRPLSYDNTKNQTLVEAIPYTGRQHQIRVHLNSIGHTIVGDPIYGLQEKYANKILLKQVSKKERIEITKASRLNLHAAYLEFVFLKRRYVFCSEESFTQEEIVEY